LGFFHQVTLTAISLLVIYMIKYCREMGNSIREASSGLIGNSKNSGLRSRRMYDIISDMQMYQRSAWWLILPIFPCISFIGKNFRLGYVPVSVTGCYAVCFGASAFYLALVAYIHLVVSIVFFWKLAHDQGGCIPLRFPSDLASPPKWLELWSRYFQKAESAFFISGTLFTLEYTILMPQDIVTFDKGIVIHSVDPVGFVTGWLTIIILIIFAFPVIAILIRHCFHKLLIQMRTRITNEFQSLTQGKKEDHSLLEYWAYNQLVSSFKYGSYIFQRKAIVPVLSTSISLVLNLAKLYESVFTPFILGE